MDNFICPKCCKDELEKVGENTNGDTLWCNSCGTIVYTKYSYSHEKLKVVVDEFVSPRITKMSKIDGMG